MRSSMNKQPAITSRSLQLFFRENWELLPSSLGWSKVFLKRYCFGQNKCISLYLRWRLGWYAWCMGSMCCGGIWCLGCFSWLTLACFVKSIVCWNILSSFWPFCLANKLTSDSFNNSGSDISLICSIHIGEMTLVRNFAEFTHTISNFSWTCLCAVMCCFLNQMFLPRTEFIGNLFNFVSWLTLYV